MKPRAARSVKVVIVEAHTLYARALALVLENDDDIEVTAEIKRIDSPALGAATPDLILIDLDTHSLDLGEALRVCRKETPKALVCVLTQHLKPEVMQRCLSLGVDGFFAKDMEPADFTRAVKSVASGMSYVDPRVAGGLLRRRSAPDFETPSDELSLRELDIVRLIADGLSNKEISARLYLSEKTIKNHTARIFAKFGVSARTQVAVYALKAGIV